MTTEMIEKKINKYYKGKIAILVSLLSGLVFLIVAMITYLLTENSWAANILVLSYFGILFIFVVAILFPVGKYNLKKYVSEKGDIKAILEYLNSFKGGHDKYLDMLLIIRRTVQAVIDDSMFMNRCNAKGEEQRWTQAWDRLYMRLFERDVHYIKREFLKARIEEINQEFNILVTDGKNDCDESVKECESSIHQIRWNVILITICTVLLFILVIGKIVIVGLNLEETVVVGPISIVYKTGSDVLALIFALYAAKSEVKG